MYFNWSDIQSSSPKSWKCFELWLKEKKEADKVRVVKDPDPDVKEYLVITRRYRMNEVVSLEMLYEFFDAKEKRIIVGFDEDEKDFLWGYTIYSRKENSGFWVTDLVNDNTFLGRKLATDHALKSTFRLIDEGLK